MTSKAAHPAYHEIGQGTDKAGKSEHSGSGKTMTITRLTEVIEITAAGIAETIEIVQAARIITTETKSHTT